MLVQSNMPRKKTIPQKVDDILASFGVRSNDPQRFKDKLAKLIDREANKKAEEIIYNINSDENLIHR